VTHDEDFSKRDVKILLIMIFGPPTIDHNTL
jgi:hypothetical protein